MQLNDKDRRALEDIVRFGNDALTYIGDLTEEAFLADRKSQQAAMYAV